MILERILGRSRITMLGVSASYFGMSATVEDNYVDDVQVIPLMLDFRQAFYRSDNDRFSTWLFVDAGYVFSITGNEMDVEGEFEFGDGWGINSGISIRHHTFSKAGFALDLGWFRHTSRMKWLPPSEKSGQRAWNLGMARLTFFF
ncbi:MAG: hypothetical protein SFV22_04100 [Saprospiraceae bacterium]|nr:hypothetical protein [Saprospiraceae bacterium]